MGQVSCSSPVQNLEALETKCHSSKPSLAWPIHTGLRACVWPQLFMEDVLVCWAISVARSPLTFGYTFVALLSGMG